ncbi:hypothetical protein BOSP111201_24290 [Bordetella sputigena]|uniref:hypothetical protein n=1 Tax=Bordetella sputigena TaxID=1416810 RepID=UPI0039EFF7DE
MQHAYTVTLHHPFLSASRRQEADVQYRQALEQALGGADGVLRAWHAWQEAEHKLGSLSNETWKVARQWLVASDQARQIALAGKNAPGATDAYFEGQASGRAYEARAYAA